MPQFGRLVSVVVFWAVLSVAASDAQSFLQQSTARRTSLQQARASAEDRLRRRAADLAEALRRDWPTSLLNVDLDFDSDIDSGDGGRDALVRATRRHLRREAELLRDADSSAATLMKA
mmetsp:Transcript_5107/g.16539  ORF Transcript_5107/g.16539 Transcript_5107/m.16539 type:complete len:118 (-) Transcript_5107:844-1197(-)